MNAYNQKMRLVPTTRVPSLSVSRDKLLLAVTVLSVLALLLAAGTADSVYLYLLYVLMPLTLYRPEMLLPVYFVASLSSNFFVATEGIGVTRLLATVIIIGVLHKIYRVRKGIQKKWLNHCLIIGLLCLAPYIFAYDNDPFPLFVMWLNLLVFISISNLDLEMAEVILLFRDIFAAVLITSIFYCMMFVQNPHFLNDGRLTVAEGINENNFGMMMAQLSAFSFGYMIFTKHKIAKVVCCCSWLVNFIFVILTGSRSALLGLIAGCILSYLTLVYVHGNYRRGILITIVIFTLLLPIMYFTIESSPVLKDRMTADSVISSGGTRRWPRVVAEIQYVIPEHPLFGVGLSAINETLAQAPYLSDRGSSHNFFVSALTQVGFLGFLAFMTFYWKIVREVILRLKSNKVLFIPLVLILTAFINGIGEVMYSERLFWNTISLAALCLNACMQLRPSMLNTSPLHQETYLHK